ncbi:MAG: BMP family ABC transporter substrate-binding protein [Lachnospiraceae bacterium]|nr:BMP family ABC transporter substrate-binding protein [Candidatus Equihabitans merdae]
MKIKNKVKRWQAMCLAAIMAFSLSGCGGDAKDSIAMVTSGNYAGNKAACQAWNGVQVFASSEDGVANRYEVSTADAAAADKQIKTIMKEGNTAAVFVGNDLEQSLYKAQEGNKDVRFIMIGGQPRPEEGADPSIGENTLCVVFNNTELGYLAGYGAVYEGYRHLGFIAGTRSADAIAYESGFIAGVKACAADLALEAGAVVVDEHYTESDALSPLVMEAALNQYDNGCQIIMAYGHQINRAVIKAAEKRNKLVISAGEDLRGESGAVLMGCAFDCAAAVEKALASCKSESFAGGTSVHYGAADNAISLCMSPDRFTTFTEADYQRIFGELSSGARTAPQDNNVAGDAFVTVNQQ